MPKYTPKPPHRVCAGDAPKQGGPLVLATPRERADEDVVREREGEVNCPDPRGREEEAEDGGARGGGGEGVHGVGGLEEGNMQGVVEAVREALGEGAGEEEDDGVDEVVEGWVERDWCGRGEGGPVKVEEVAGCGAQGSGRREDEVGEEEGGCV